MHIFWIDLFCGFGGTTTGIEKARVNATVVACVNHDALAIASHKANHPNCEHFEEDIRDPKVVIKLKLLVARLRKQYPGCFINLWASLECTNYSKAKGGLPREGDSRTLAKSLYMLWDDERKIHIKGDSYIQAIQPDCIYIENVREFMAWGPLDHTGRPISRRNGSDFMKWRNEIQELGYTYDDKLLNAANFGAYTSRERYFGQFAKTGIPICWPEETHAKKVPEEQGMFRSSKKKWKPVREVLDLENEGKSIFEREKPLSENTLKRIYAGLIKFIANGQEEYLYHNHGGEPGSKVWGVERPTRTVLGSNTPNKVKAVFLKKYYSGKPAGKVIPVEGPAGTITCIDGHALVQSIFLSTYYTGSNGNHSIEGPAPTVTTKDRISKIEAEFLVQYQGKSDVRSTKEPCGTLLTKDKFGKVQPKFFVNNYSGGGQNSSIEGLSPTITTVPKQNIASCEFIDQQYGNSKPSSPNEPAGTITANPKFAIVQAKPWLMDTNFNNVGSSIDAPARVITANRKWHYLMNPQFGSKGSSPDLPAPTLIARMDKKPLYLVEAETGDLAIVVYEDDSEMMVKIKQFMAAYGIADIKMRMLMIKELLLIQGFPPDYQMKGTKTDQKKFIGNSVHPDVAEALVVSNAKALSKYFTAVA